VNSPPAGTRTRESGAQKPTVPVRYGGGADQAGHAHLELMEAGDGAGQGELAARGALTFITARAARELGLAAIRGATASALHIDCSAISASDSAGMSVLLDWLAGAVHAQRSLHFRNLPAQVQAIAKISDVLELLERGV